MKKARNIKKLKTKYKYFYRKPATLSVKIHPTWVTISCHYSIGRGFAMYHFLYLIEIPKFLQIYIWWDLEITGSIDGGETTDCLFALIQK